MSGQMIDIKTIIDESASEIAVFTATCKTFLQLFQDHFPDRGAMRYEVDDALIDNGYSLQPFEKYLDRVFAANEYVTETDFKQHTDYAIAARIKTRIEAAI